MGSQVVACFAIVLLIALVFGVCWAGLNVIVFSLSGEEGPFWQWLVGGERRFWQRFFGKKYP